MAFRIFVTRNLPGTSLERLKSVHDVDIWEQERPPTSDEIKTRACNCEGIITLLSDNVNRSLIEALPSLKVIAQYAVGYDNINIEFATERGIMVTNTPGVLTETTADLAWALIMAASRRIPEADRYVKSGKWKVAWGPEMLLGVDIHGATLGILGMGRIGYAVAKRAIGFGMKIIYYSRNETEITDLAERYLSARRVSYEQLLSDSDILSLHVPLTPETRGAISDSEFSKMKKGSILVNTSRGPVVDEVALYEALTIGNLRAAGLDVFQEEPTPNSNRLVHLDNVVSLPHIGSASITTRAKMAEICVNNLLQALRGDTPVNLVNPEVLSKIK